MNRFIYLPQLGENLSCCCSTFLWKGWRWLANLDEYLTKEGKHASLSLAELFLLEQARKTWRPFYHVAPSSGSRAWSRLTLGCRRGWLPRPGSVTPLPQANTVLRDLPDAHWKGTWTEGTCQGVPIVPLCFFIIIKMVLAYYSLLSLGHISQTSVWEIPTLLGEKRGL